MKTTKSLKIKKMFALAFENYKKKKFKIAENIYKEIIEIDPSHASAHNNLGLIFELFRENKKAINSYQKAIQINPNHVLAYNNIGQVFKELGEYKKAIGCYEQAIQIQPNYAETFYNLGNVLHELGNLKKAIKYYEKALELEPNFINPQVNISNIYLSQLDNLEKAINASYKTLKIQQEKSKFINHKISFYRLKHDVQQAEYLSSKNYKIKGIEKFKKVGNEILGRKENRKEIGDSDKKILLKQNEIKSLLPFYKENLIYQTSKISETCINPNKNWKDVEEQYLNSPKQIIYIDNFLSEEAVRELREFCLVSKIWSTEYKNKYLGAFSERGFASPIHLQIAIDLKQKLPQLFGQHLLGKFWAFKYDATLGQGINIHADFALINLNFWITPDEYNNNKDSGGLKVYDAPAPEDWTFQQYNANPKDIYKFLKDNNANCTNVPYKFNRAVLFNSAYFHETDEINFRDGYEARRINITYLFGNRLVKKVVKKKE